MKNKHLKAFLVNGKVIYNDDIPKVVASKLVEVQRDLNEAHNNGLDQTTIFALDDLEESLIIELARLENISLARIQHEINKAKNQHIVAESTYLNADNDDSPVTEKISLLNNWGHALVRAKICEATINENINRFRTEASLLHKQLAPKKRSGENVLSTDVWASYFAETLKIFSKLNIDENHIMLFLQLSLSDTVVQ